MWVVTFFSLLGTILNIKKKKICFWIWLFTNVTWCVYDYMIGAYAQSCLFLIYTGLAIWGIIEWQKSN